MDPPNTRDISSIWWIHTPCRPSAVRSRDQDDPRDNAHLEGEISAKRQMTSEHGTFVFGESSSDSYAIDDDEIPTEKVSQELVDEMSHNVDETKLRKKNLHAKIIYIKKQKELRKPKEVVYSNSKIIQNIKTYWELGHKHKFITEIVARRENGSITLITESDYKNLNKNDIEEMYLLIVNNKVDNYVETHLLWSFSHGYVTPCLSNEDAEYLQLFEEEIEERLKHHDQMRCLRVEIVWTPVWAFGYVLDWDITQGGGGTDGRAGRGGGRTRGRFSDQGNGRIDGQVSEFTSHYCSPSRKVEVKEMEFLACNYKEYDGKGYAIVYTHWIKKMESVQDISGCRDSQKVAYTAGLFVGRNFSLVMRYKSWKLSYRITPWSGLAMLRIRIGFISWLATKTRTIQKAVQIAGTLTDEALRNGSIKKNHENRGTRGEPSRDRNVRDDNKRTRTGNVFATTANPARREYTCTAPKCTTCNYHHSPETPCHSCFNCNRLGHFAKDCRVATRNVNPVNARNPIARTCYKCGSTDHNKLACLSFVSTTFISLLGIEPSDLGFSYEIEIASRQLVEIDKVIKGCTLEIEGLVFDINLIPFRSSSFDVIVGMDWLSDHKAEIICHVKVVRIPLLDGKVLRVLGEKLEEKIRQLMSAKAKEKKQEETVVLKDFPEVFLDDLSRLPLVREIKLRIELVPEAMPVANSSYRLEPSELEELLGQLEELERYCNLTYKGGSVEF
uniref:CCHC-type domain-containing protein n=1 Tax=Tanacetum cinerariifolium TaxID=118510 RepID=A0A6L2NSN0_TANCI|nr:hypothetical protein [Tanacetum cinerariifolium]